MADCGIASRRKCEEIISAGKVKVNGHPAKVGDKVNSKKDLVTVYGKKINKTAEMRYIMLNKPRGYGRDCVVNLIEGIDARLYPVGRLDRDSEGLLLFTNDGALANALMHPSGNITKIYRVTVRPAVNDDMLDKLRNGVEIDGRKTLPCDVTLLTEEDDRVVLEFGIREGRNREIRKMCEAVGLEVARLKRIAEGPVKLGMLPLGKFRDLTPREIEKLQKLVDKK